MMDLLKVHCAAWLLNILLSISTAVAQVVGWPGNG
jgi:hypothetical protein